jgi:uncharacterized glyoxalase superfamily protein PhnB
MEDEMGEQGLFPYLEYKDVTEAVRWLHNALGFDLLSASPEGEGATLTSAVMKRAGGVIMLGTAAKKSVPKGQGLYIWTADPDGVFERAVQEGAKVVTAPEDHDVARRRALVLDPEGHEWTFGATEPGAGLVRRV